MERRYDRGVAYQCSQYARSPNQLEKRGKGQPPIVSTVCTNSFHVQNTIQESHEESHVDLQSAALIATPPDDISISKEVRQLQHQPVMNEGVVG
jgi:hypothetical protein